MLKKILVGIIVLVLLVVAAIIIAPFFLKDDIVAYIKKETLNADLNFDENIELSIISSFPQIKLGINHISIVNRAPFAGDTLMNIESVKVKLDFMSLFGESIKVNSIELTQPYFNVLVTKDGKANYDIALPSEETVDETTDEPSAPYQLRLESFTIKQAKINYFDTSLATLCRIRNFNFSLGGDFDPEEMAISTETSIDQLSVVFDGIKYLNRVNTLLKADLVINLEEGKYQFKDNELQINQVVLGMDGMFQMTEEDYTMDLTYALKRSDFKDLLSLVPVVFTQDFEGLKADGKFALEGALKGTYNDNSYPAFDLHMAVENGTFKYPDLPSSLNNTNINLDINNPDGVIDHTIVNLSKCHLELDKEPFDMVAMVKTPESDLFVDAKLKGKINLANVKSLVPLETITKLSGILQMDLHTKGNLSAIEKEEYEKFQADGNLSLNNFIYADKDLAEEIGISQCAFTFTPKAALLEKLNMTMGKSDLNMDGELYNYIAYVLRDDVIKGSLNLKSQFFDINPWMTDENSDAEGEESDDYEMEIFQVPGNVNFVMNSSFNQLIYDTYDMRNFVGTVEVAEGILKLKEVGLEMLGGKMNLDGFYNTTIPGSALTGFNFQMSNLSIPGMYETFMTFQEFVPLAKQIEGNVSGLIQIDSKLGSDMMPEMNSINGIAKLSIPKMVLSGNTTWNKIVETLHWSESKKRLLIENVKPTIKFKDGRMYLDTTNFNIDKAKCSLSGSSGFDQTIDYLLVTEVSSKLFASQANDMIGKLLNGSSTVAIDPMVKIGLSITGTFENPVITPKLIGGNNMKNSLIVAGKAKIDEMKDKAKTTIITKTKEQLADEAALLRKQAAELRSKAEALKKEAADLNKKAQGLKAESEAIRKEADKSKKEIEDKMSGLPKVAKDKAMIPVNNLFSKADSKLTEANKVFDLAKKPEQEADKLLTKANELDAKAQALLQ